MPHGRRMGVRGARRLAGWLRQRERGQMLLVFALLVIPVSFVLAAVAVDASLWQSERRGAQKDADLAALAGAFELAQKVPDSAAADTAARGSLVTNDEAGNGGSVPANVRNVTVDNSCFNTGRPDAVTVDVDHGSRTFFSGIFGIDIAPEIGAHAKACAGSVQAPNGLVPIEINTSMALCFEDEDGDGENDPQIGQPCPMEFGASNNPQGPNPRGILDLQAPGDYCSDASGSGDLEDLIEFGAAGTCLINETSSAAAATPRCGCSTCSAPVATCVPASTS